MWSKILDTELGSFATARMHDNDCNYHNFDHILAMYSFLEQNKQPYNEALDWAVLFHDIVYDAEPEKERRSADLFLEVSVGILDNELRYVVEELIMATANHRLYYGANTELCSAIIKADLHGLTDTRQTLYNFVNIMDESIKLYSIDIDEYVGNTIAFMLLLRRTMHYNRKFRASNDAAFFEKVIKGINQTIALARALLKD